MNKFIFAAVAPATLTAAAIGLAGTAAAAPTGSGSAQDTVSMLQSSGYRVILNKIGAKPLDQCSVQSVRSGEAITTPVTAGAGSLTQKVEYTTVYVTASC
jgi:hypothetical protein